MVKRSVRRLMVRVIVFIVEVFVSPVTVRNEPKFTVGSPYKDIKLQHNSSEYLLRLLVLKISIGPINY